MNRILERIASCVAVTGAVALMLGAACYVVGFRINTTRSIPVGLYWTSRVPVAKNTYVMFCPPNVSIFAVARKRGYIDDGVCPGGYGYMMKRVAATKGDIVNVTDTGIRVNGHLLPHSKPLAADPGGRPLQRWQNEHYTLDDSELLLMSDVSDLSFDGRYFGPINRSQIKSVIRPILTW
jgi:conjugative transfer signal peptidase TraF